MNGLQAPATLPIDQVFALIGSTVRIVTALLVVMMGLSEWGRTRREAFRDLGIAFLFVAAGQVLAGLQPFLAGELQQVAHLGIPVWLHLFEIGFLVFVCHAVAVHERERANELKKVTRWLLGFSILLTAAVQTAWYVQAVDQPERTFLTYPGKFVLVGWGWILLLLGIALAKRLRPEIRVLPALGLLALGEMARTANLWLFAGTEIWLRTIHWSTGALAAVLLLVAAHFGIVTETFTDALTRLNNRRYFLMRVGEEFDRATRRGAPISILVMDLDHFKRFNDTQGHVAGDTLLRSVARVLNKHLRPYDILCRWGGEEFIALLPETDVETGAVIAERLRQAVADLFGSPDRRSPVTISIGVAAYPNVSADWRQVVQAADQALYKAKERRNRVSVYSADP